ncbi:hypothetical protein A2Z22_02325 [Candidatus Woesebacteria bacterium RBG_16_34_12]|uniref:Ribosomal RNA methyltransferase FtsJ domain-containing protein n=1 Tax=Candidatus Woesebacteria bacterium RBG_16_34_12 TaxID=1802480 RepID=A0A1F7X9A2_9BACT|nr:MAG: hypothetical protein A2Z22_02325 [Candidatus Woesebacteria bacterium RBG_16_34_12]
MGKFVSRAGEKLQFALTNFKIPVNNKICADFGTSTGGFTDCLLQNGAKKIYSIDTAYGELAWNLRNNPNVVVLERTNAMHVKLPEKVDVITIDVAWTKQKNILPNAFNNLKRNGIVITLIKPHYEAQAKYVRKGKLITEKTEEVLEEVRKDIKRLGGNIIDIIVSPIVGERKGNQEFLAYLKVKNLTDLT